MARLRLSRLVWLGGAAWVTWWYAARAETGVVGTVAVTVVALLLLGAAMASPERRT